MWVSSKEFAELLGKTDRAVRKQAQTKKILCFNTKYFAYNFINGIGGNAGKVLQIWDCALTSSQVEALEKGYPLSEVLEQAESQVCKDTESKNLWFSLTPKQQEVAKEKLEIIEEYKKAQANGIKSFTFIARINVKYPSLNLNESKLFDWIRKYKKGGISALADLRGANRAGASKISKQHQEAILNLWRAFGNGHCNFSSLWRKFHQSYLSSKNYRAFLRGEMEPLVSLSTFTRFLNGYIAKNAFEACLVMHGEDKTESRFAPAYGLQRALAKEPNAIWQIDSSPLDAMVLDSDGKQMRPSIVSAVDVYSGRGVMYLCQHSDANAILRLLWKAFREMGKPKAIKCDNGKDYLSGKVQDLLRGLGIDMQRSHAYSGKEKAMVERRFGTIQGDIFAAMSGGLGRNNAERASMEERTAKRNRGGKDKAGNPIKTNQKNLHSYSDVAVFLDEAVENWNLDRVSRKGKKSPIDLWNEADFTRESVSYANFLLYAGEGQVRSVTKGGITYGNVFYSPLKHIDNKTKVNVRVCLDDNSKIFVFNEKGEFICEARNKEIAPLSSEELKKIKSAYSAKLSALRKAIKEAGNSAYMQELLRAEEVRLTQEYKQAINEGLNVGRVITKRVLDVGMQEINNRNTKKSDFNWDEVGAEFFSSQA